MTTKKVSWFRRVEMFDEEIHLQVSQNQRLSQMSSNPNLKPQSNQFSSTFLPFPANHDSAGGTDVIAMFLCFLVPRRSSSAGAAGERSSGPAPIRCLSVPTKVLIHTEHEIFLFHLIWPFYRINAARPAGRLVTDS